MECGVWSWGFGSVGSQLATRVAHVRVCDSAGVDMTSRKHRDAAPYTANHLLIEHTHKALSPPAPATPACTRNTRTRNTHTHTHPHLVQHHPQPPDAQQPAPPARAVQLAAQYGVAGEHHVLRAQHRGRGGALRTVVLVHLRVRAYVKEHKENMRACVCVCVLKTKRKCVCVCVGVKK